MKVPVKGRWCDHYHCFDLDSFLTTNLQCPKWMCPENKKDTPVKLYRDEFTMHLLQLATSDDTHVNIDCSEMKATFNKSGLEFKITQD